MLRIVTLFTLLLFSLPVLADPPATERKPVKNTYHGVTVTDPYRWLEDGASKDVRAWSEAQNKYARDYLAGIPASKAIRTQLEKILTARTVTHSGIVKAGDNIFARKRQPPREQPILVVMPAIVQPDKARVLLDPMELDAKGTTAIDWFVPSPDGKLVAVSLSKAGSEAGDLHIYDSSTGKQVHEVIPRVQNGTAGGSVAWAPDSQGFFYTRYPRGDEKPPADRDFYQQLYFHTLGTPTEKDRYELGKDLPRIAEIKVWMDLPTGRLLCTFQDGDGGEFSHFVRGVDGKWRQFAGFKDKLVQATFGPDGDLFIVSRQNAPRGKILSLGIKDLDVSKAQVIVPESKDTIVTDFWSKPTVRATAIRLYVTYQLGGPSAIRAFTLDGKPAPAPSQLPISTVSELTPLEGDDLLFANESFLEPLGQYLYTANTGKTTKTPLTSSSPVSFKDIEIVRAFADSKDGTRVPVSILIPKGVKLDGSSPCVVTGYGGYGINLNPEYRPELRVLFDRGVIYAVANLRGGCEYGEEWQKAGSLTNKQNVFDDFAAVLKYLIEKKYTSADRLGIIGTSNGGLLMGATLTQHPELLKAAVSHVGIYDMLRVELSPNGAFNVPEFGTVKNPDHFKALHAYSPYYNVQDGMKYPAVLLLTGANDPRVDPMQSRKMAARLQSSTVGTGPILLRTSDSSGHGMDTSLSERIAELTDVYAFLGAQLNVK